MIHVGIIETGHPAEAIVARYGSYPHMFRDYFSARNDMDFYSFSVLENQPLPSAKKCDAWLITGSAAAAYDEHVWLPPLREFVRNAISSNHPILGICFGHQVMAQAMGGVVQKSVKGRGIGVHQYDLTPEGEALLPGKHQINLIAAHEDQVVTPAPEGRLLVTSPFCTYAGFAYGTSALSLQGHPEFSPDYERDLIKQWQIRSPTDEATVEQAMKTLDTMKTDSKSIAPVLGKFLARETAI